MKPAFKFLNFCQAFFCLTIGFFLIAFWNGQSGFDVWFPIIVSLVGICLTGLIKHRLLEIEP